MKVLHLKYKQETGLDAPRIERFDDPEILYVEWLEEQLEGEIVKEILRKIDGILTSEKK